MQNEIFDEARWAVESSTMELQKSRQKKRPQAQKDDGALK